MIYILGIVLAWNPNPEPDLAGYRVYYSQVQAQNLQVKDVGNVTTAILDLPPGKWWFAVTAYDNSGNESGFSNWAMAVSSPPQQRREPERPIVIAPDTLTVSDTLRFRVRQDLKYIDGTKFAQSAIEQIEFRIETGASPWPLLFAWAPTVGVNTQTTLANLGITNNKLYRYSLQTIVGGVQSRGSTPKWIQFESTSIEFVIEVKIQ